jgi:hypothetical protein
VIEMIVRQSDGLELLPKLRSQGVRLLSHNHSVLGSAVVSVVSGA